MDRFLPLLLLLTLVGCMHRKTTEEEKELNEFAQARQRAATYYDGGDYSRAAAQYLKTLELKPDHVPSQLGYAYSLMRTDLPRHQITAEKNLTEMGVQEDERWEVKRIYCLAMVHRNLGKHYQRRSRIRGQEGNLRGSATDLTASHEHARLSIGFFKTVLDIDDRMATRYSAGRRVSASLKPDAYVGMAHCEIILGDADHLDHFERAVEYIQKFAAIARTARRFWNEQRKRTLAEDPLTAGTKGDAGTATPSQEERKRYERRIFNTIREEVTVRRALLDTFLYLNQYVHAIQEANRILSLDPSTDQILLLRGRAYAALTPPNYEAAVRDLKAYRARQDLDRLTETLVRLNKLIKTYEERLASEFAGGES